MRASGVKIFSEVMKFRSVYRVRSSEMTPDYLLKDYYVGMYFQECFAEYAAARKCAAYDVAADGLTWLTVEGGVEFFPPMPFWRCPVEVSVWVYKIGAVRMRTNFEAHCDGRRIARGYSINLMADLNTHRPQKSAVVAGRFETCGEDVFPEAESACKIDMSDGAPVVGRLVQTVRFDDLDFNMHLNNVRYIPRALEALDLDYRLAHSLKSYRIKFEREARFGDEIESVAAGGSGVFSHLLRRVSDGAPLCAMRTFWQPNAAAERGRP